MLSPDLLDLLSALCESEARFLVVGGYAVGIRGRPRATKDLDVWVEASRESGVSFKRAWARRISAAFGADLVCPVIGLADLLTNKRASARPQDLADVDALERLASLRKTTVARSRPSEPARGAGPAPPKRRAKR